MSAAETAPAAGQASPEVFHRIGALTRQLHDSLRELGYMPRLEDAAHQLPDAKSRLSYIATKTGEAAERVLNLVDQAKSEQEHMVAETRRIAKAVVADPVKAVASGALMNFVGDVEAATARIDQHLTEIMIAQDFHDLTGQVVAKVVKLAADLEDQLVALLRQTMPPEQAHKIESALQPAAASEPSGPVVNPEGRSDVVTNQEQVDDLLSILGF